MHFSLQGAKAVSIDPTESLTPRFTVRRHADPANGSKQGLRKLRLVLPLSYYFWQHAPHCSPEHEFLILSQTLVLGESETQLNHPTVGEWMALFNAKPCRGSIFHLSSMDLTAIFRERAQPSFGGSNSLSGIRSKAIMDVCEFNKGLVHPLKCSLLGSKYFPC
jgi:hypothetical protein